MDDLDYYVLESDEFSATHNYFKSESEAIAYIKEEEKNDEESSKRLGWTVSRCFTLIEGREVDYNEDK